jgi:hypothetical protein
MKRTAQVARTAYDLKHLSRLRVPEFGALKIRLTASGKSSKAHVLDTAPAPESNDGSDDFHFAPGPQLDSTTWAVDASKTDKVTIEYQLLNPFASITKATLELFCRYGTDAIWKRELKDKELLDGEHKLEFNSKAEWDGAIDVDPKFPDGFVTVDRSPYKLKLTVEGDGVCLSPTAWTYFHVLIAKLELEYGPPEVLPVTAVDKPDHRKVLTAVKAQGAAPPAPGATAIKVFLESNLFKKGHSMFDNSLYTEYKKMWTTGPLIPIFAKVWIKDSGDQPVLAPKALGLTKFLWDWESKLAATGNTFVDQAQDFNVNATKPKGQNCHVERGGKRGTGGDPVFPPQAGYDAKSPLDDGVFPFPVTACGDPRKWSVFSQAWRDKTLASKTGVLFQPARMAGDIYTVSVYVAWDTAEDGKVILNTDADPPLKVQACLKAESGPFQVWRKVHLAGHVRKNSSTSALNIAAIPSNYTPAFLDFQDISGGSTTVTKSVWNTAFASAISAWGDIDKLLVDPAVDQYDQGPIGAYFRGRDDFGKAWVAYLLLHVYSNVAAADAANYASLAWAAGTGGTAAADAVRAQALLDGYSATDADALAAQTAAGFTYVKTYIDNVANNLETDAKFAKWCEGKAFEILKSIFNDHLGAKDGVNVFQTDKSHNLVHLQAGLVDGEANDFPKGSDRKCGFLFVGWPALYAGRSVSGENVAAHEFGHHFLLPHPPDVDGTDYKAHDKDVTNCLMSYATVALTLCGLCRLRLRGWDKDKLDPDGTKNQKT